LIPGRIHTVIFSDKAMANRQYRSEGGVFVDVNLRDVEPHMLKMVRKNTYISLKNDNYVTGRSWEMAGYMALHGVKGEVFSGTVEPIQTTNTATVPSVTIVKFGAVPGRS